MRLTIEAGPRAIARSPSDSLRRCDVSLQLNRSNVPATAIALRFDLSGADAFV
jgi:hypothetical protein